MQLPELVQWIGHLQKWTMGVTSQATKQVLGRGTQVDDGRPVVQCLSIGLANNGAATCCQHGVGKVCQLCDHFLFDVAKALLTFPLEEAPDGAPNAFLDLRVGVLEVQVQLPRKVAPDGGLSTARHCDQ